MDAMLGEGKTLEVRPLEGGVPAVLGLTPS